jgi:hypothetical protein
MNQPFMPDAAAGDLSEPPPGSLSLRAAAAMSDWSDVETNDPG